MAEHLGREMEAWQALQREAPDTALPLLYIAYDGTGVPMTKKELTGRKGKDGPAHTREAKLGCVFTQTAPDAKGFPVRDPGSTTFVGAIETAEPFGERIYREAVRRGLLHAQRVVVLGDGAEWIKTIADLHFPQATVIIDLYHAREHVAELCKNLFGTDEQQVRQQRIRWWTYPRPRKGGENPRSGAAETSPQR